MSIAVRYVVALIVLALGDVFWLGYFAHAVFQPTLAAIMREHTQWPAAILFYLLYALGIVIFAASPALANRSGRQALVSGLLFGFFAYMTYDLTNYATLSAWTVKLATMDVAWGTFISGVAAYVSYALTRLLTRA